MSGCLSSALSRQASLPDLVKSELNGGELVWSIQFIWEVYGCKHKISRVCGRLFQLTHNSEFRDTTQSQPIRNGRC